MAGHRSQFGRRLVCAKVALSASATGALLVSWPAMAQGDLPSAPAQAAVTPQITPPPVDASPATAPAAAAEQAAGDENADIVVLGVRGAQRAAVDRKRASSQIVDSIVAEDIGKLPDTTIADSLQRVPGIQIGRSAGEGSTVNIRGLSQALVTINGETFLGGQSIDGAQPNFTDIPPTLFSGVDVYKSTSAGQLEGGVSGVINLRTRRPFELEKGVTLSGNAEGSYGTRVKNLNQTYSALAGYRNDIWGVLIAGSYSDATLANATITAGTNWLITTDAKSGKDLRGDGDITDSNRRADGDYAYQTAGLAFTNRENDRKRYGLNIAAQSQLTDALTFTGELAYARLEDTEHQVSVSPSANATPLPLLAGSQVDSNGVIEKSHFLLPGFLVTSISTPSKSQSYNSNLQLEWNDGGPFKASARWVHGYARRESQTSRVDSRNIQGATVRRGDTAACRANPASCTGPVNPAGYTAIDLSTDYTTKYPSLSFGTDISDPSRYILFSAFGFGDDRKAESDVYRLDATYDAGWSVLKSVEFGARYNTRGVDVVQYRYLAPVTVPGLGTLDRPGDLYYFKDPQIGHTGRPEIQGLSVLPIYSYAALGDRIKSFKNFAYAGLPTAGVPSVDPKQMDDVLGFQNSLYPGNAAYVNPTTSFRVRERNLTSYAQVNFEGQTGLNDIGFSGNVGARLIRTKRTILANVTDNSRFIGTGGNYNGVLLNLGVAETERTYTRVLPAANLTFDVTSNQKLRFAAAKVVGALNLGDLGGGQVRNYIANNGRYPGLPSDLQVFLSGSSGNPDLQPYQANNYNASYEWYFGRGGLLSAGAFLIDVKSFPLSVIEIQPIPDQDGVVRNGGPVTTVGNGKGGTIKGLEFGYQQQFDFLPGALSGLGINANYTYSDSQSANVDFFGKAVPVPDNSKHQYNIIGLYQKSGIQARVAYNWRSKRFARLQPINLTGDKDVLAAFSKPVGYLDASASYDVTPKFTVFVQGTNLTNAFDNQYLQFENQFYNQTLFERRFTVGLRIRN